MHDRGNAYDIIEDHDIIICKTCTYSHTIIVQSSMQYVFIK